MRAFQLTAPGHAALVDVAEPRPGPHDVVLQVKAAGVCRTDLDVLRSGAPRLPVILGHEIVGEVVDAGAEANGVPLGATVAVYEFIGCGRCAPCRRGEDNLCRAGVPDVPGIMRDGGFAERVAVPARNVVELGAVDPIAAAPLTDAGMTALHAVEHGRTWLRADATVVVVGVGGLGHLAVQLVAATSEARVLVVDVDAERLELAAELGAAGGVLAAEAANGGLLEAAGGPVDVVLDFVGSQQSLDLAARVTARGGAIIVTGGGGGKLSITAEIGAGRAPEREVTMVHTFGGTRADLARTIALAETGRLHTRVQAFGLEEAEHVLAELEAGRVLGRAVLVPPS